MPPKYICANTRHDTISRSTACPHEAILAREAVGILQPNHSMGEYVYVLVGGQMPDGLEELMGTSNVLRGSTGLPPLPEVEAEPAGEDDS